MLEYNSHIYVLEEKEVTINTVMGFLLKDDCNIIYVTKDKRYMGCITVGNVAGRSEDKEKWINKTSKRIYNSDSEKQEAKEIFIKHDLIQNIPIVNKWTGQILYEYKYRTSSKNKKQVEENRNELLNKFSKLLKIEKARKDKILKIVENIIFIENDLVNLFNEELIDYVNVCSMESIPNCIDTMKIMDKRTLILGVNGKMRKMFTLNNNYVWYMTIDEFIENWEDEEDKENIFLSKSAIMYSNFFSYKKDKTIFLNFLELLYSCEYNKQIKIRKKSYLSSLKVMECCPNEIAEDFTKDKFFDILHLFFKRTSDQEWDIYFMEKTIWTEEFIHRYGNEYKILYSSAINKSESGKTMIVENIYNKVGENYRAFTKKEKYCRIVTIEELISIVLNQMLIEYFGEALKKRSIFVEYVNNDWSREHPLFPQITTTYSYEKRGKYTRDLLITNIERNEDFLREVFEEKFSYEYVKNVLKSQIYIALEDGRMKQYDTITPYINIIDGIRKTTNIPITHTNKIFLMGNCLFFGYAVEDQDTLASFLQRMINKRCIGKRWEVVNPAFLTNYFVTMYKRLYEIEFEKGDIVVFLGDNLHISNKQERDKYDITNGIEAYKEEKEFYFDDVLHCNHKGYKRIAESLYEILEQRLSFQNHVSMKEEKIYLEQEYESVSIHESLQIYLNNMKELTKRVWGKGMEGEGVKGAIVMNCNPFTLGHQYLIEYASERVDFLYVFVVEEDKSFFCFKDRIELVKRGTKHINNLCIMPSGQFMISTKTFPEYFAKDDLQEVVIDSSKDIQIFCQHIAKELGISKRFVGEEPTDMVTRQYNEEMLKKFPRYGIELIEIPRKMVCKQIISASTVRTLLDNKVWNKIMELVPQSTYKFLNNKYNNEY